MKDLQKRLHPDRFGQSVRAEQEHAAEQSSAVNLAWNALKSPHTRAQHLLELSGIDALGEGGTAETSPLLLMEVMERREALSECAPGDRAALERMAVDVRADASECVERFGAAFDAAGGADLGAATEEAVRLQYLTKLLEEIRDKS